MTLKLGRASLRTPHDVQVVRRNSIDQGRLVTGYENPGKAGTGARGFLAAGSEVGAAAQAAVDAADLEAVRQGAVYCVDDSASPAVPAGYYLVADFQYDKPRGSPRVRPWRLQLWEATVPFVARQAESDNSAGSDVLDATADEGSRVDYVTTGAYAAVLAPAGIAGAEALNLPAGTYKAVLRAWAVTTATAQARLLTRDLTPATLVTGADVTLATAGAWADYDLGSFTVADANDRANWYQLDVRDTVNVGSTVRLDRLYLVPTA